MTEKLVIDLASGGSSEVVCKISVADLDQASGWPEVSAGEPEEFAAGQWDGQQALGPQWSINSEELLEGAGPGSNCPGDVFYRETDDGLCASNVAWATLVAVG